MILFWMIILLLFLWFIEGDADLTTLFAHTFLRSRREKYRKEVVWITGASSAIGEEIAYDFAKLGCRLVISGTRQQELERVRDACQTLCADCEVMIVCGNIADTTKHAGLIEDVVKKFGEIHVLVHNAGRSQRSKFHNTPEETEREIFEIDTFAVMSLTKLVMSKWIKERQQDRGILIISCYAGKFGAPYSAAYSANKHALHGFFESIRPELSIEEANERITLACPGSVRRNDTPNTRYRSFMNPSRCAELMVSAFAAGLDGSWIAMRPELAWYYIDQSFPPISRTWLLPLEMTKEARGIQNGLRWEAILVIHD